ncbi:MAG: AraC family transcriptional regulator [Sphingobium sp.]
MNAHIPPPLAPGSVSELLSLLELRGRNWNYVELGAGAGYSAPPCDGVYVHVALYGSVRLTGVSCGTMTLAPGQIAIILSGEAHALRTQPGCTVSPLDFLRDDRTVDVPATATIGAGGGVATRLLSARLGMHWPDGLHRASLPPSIMVDMANQRSAGALLRPDAFLLAGFGAGATALLTRLASLILVAALRSDAHYLDMLQSPEVDPIDQALRLISVNPSAPWTVERLARTVGMGRSNFAAHFTAKVGKAPMEVITDRRMAQALDLLRQNNLKIAEIAEITGYGSEAAFSRRFARHFGLPPSQMREQSRQAANPAVEDAQRWHSLVVRGRLGEGSLQRRPAVAAPPVSPEGKDTPQQPFVLGLARRASGASRD